jgi:hypothetical protein
MTRSSAALIKQMRADLEAIEELVVPNENDGWKMAMGTDRCVNARESRREWPEGELPLGP